MLYLEITPVIVLVEGGHRQLFTQHGKRILEQLTEKKKTEICACVTIVIKEKRKTEPKYVTCEMDLI